MRTYTKNKDNYCIDIVDKYTLDIYTGFDISESDSYDYRNIVRRFTQDNKLYSHDGTDGQRFFSKNPDRVVKIKKTDNEKELTKVVNEELEKWINSDMLHMPKKDKAYLCVYYQDDLKYVYVVDNFLNKKKKEIKRYSAKEFFIENGRNEEEVDEEEKRLAIYGIRSGRVYLKSNVGAFIGSLFLAIILLTLVPLGMMQMKEIKDECGPISYIARTIYGLFGYTYLPIPDEQIAGAIGYDFFALAMSYMGIHASLKDLINAIRETKYYRNKIDELESDPVKRKVLEKNFKEYLKNEPEFENVNKSI